LHWWVEFRNERNATKNLNLISELVFTEQYDEDIDKFEKELNFKKAYNQTFGVVGDFYEALMQKEDESFGWEALYNAIKTSLAVKFFDHYTKIVHEADLTKQVTNYRKSIRQGHRVIVLAHSQGNLFTNEAYQKMITNDDGRDNGWLKEYFTRISIATPSSEKFGGDIVVSFHNDPVPALGSLPTIKNPNKAYQKNTLGELIDEDVMSADFHDFKYYMGEKSVEGRGAIGSGYHGKVSTDVAKNIIMDFVKNGIENHRDAQSQWATDKESGENTKDYRIIVKHMYDSNIVMSEEVYPFAPNKKLYQVKDTAGIPHYVKASFGGEKILDAEVDADIWEAKDNQYYKLAGTDPVEYIEGEDTCKDPSSFEIVSQQNENTKNWRVTVKNKETNETTEGVYPFNLNGSLYQLESGEWVIASCGGKSISSQWDEKQDNEYFRLDNFEKEKIIKNKIILPYDKIIFAITPKYGYDLNGYVSLRWVRLSIFGVNHDDKRWKQIYGKELTTSMSNGIADTSWVLYTHRHSYSYNLSNNNYIFYEARSIEDITNKLSFTWNVELKNYRYGVGVGISFPAGEVATVSFSLSQNIIDIILKQ
jgi:hypothetical protein